MNDTSETRTRAAKNASKMRPDPVSLAPLTAEQAIDALFQIPPDKLKAEAAKRKKPERGSKG